MRVTIHHCLAAVPYPLLDDRHRRSCHDQGAYSVMPEPVHTTAFQSEPAEQGVKVLVENG